MTFDGGRNWREARIDGPVLEKSLTRFYVDFDWQGEELLIQSRAHDTTGYLQPTKDALRKIAASTRSITTTGSRPGWCAPMGGPRMSRSAEHVLATAAFLIAVAAPAGLASGKRRPGAGRRRPRRSPDGRSAFAPMD